MTCFDLYNAVEDEPNVQVVINLIKQEALRKLTGDDFTIRPTAGREAVMIVPNYAPRRTRKFASGRKRLANH